jgi:hypothetical protein
MGFFGMQQKHAEHYMRMWENIGATVDFESYQIRDIFSIKKQHDIIRATYQPKNSHYDAVYCISGGCLHLLNLVQAKKSFTYDRLIFDSGPYLYSMSQTEHYIHQMYPALKVIPVKRILDLYYVNKIESKNSEYKSVVLNAPVKKLVLTSQTDRIVDQVFIADFVRQSGSTHVKFPSGTHANIYKANKEEYKSALLDFLK